MSEPDEYIKFEMKVQRGDGPDQRGDVRVELQRELDRRQEETVTDERGEECTTDQAAFAQFHYETGRAVGLLTERLGLDDRE